MRGTCPLCGRKFEVQRPLPPEYPFCTERCKLTDLGRWLGEEYSISRELTEDDLELPGASGENAPD